MKNNIRTLFPVSWKYLGITLGILVCASGLCMILQTISENDFHVPLIFLLSVLLISFFTEGYLFGLASALAAVFLVNFVFTYPYLELNFSLTGYPLTFICMLVASVIGCTMATNVKKSKSLKAQAERERMRANLMRTVSHDFRTPLTSIIGNIDLMLENEADLNIEEKASLLNDAKSEAEWLINMVENLLSVTRIGDDPKASLHKEPQTVEELIAEAVAHYKKQYQKPDVRITVPDEIVFVDADATLIEQVIVNILINAAIHAQNARFVFLTVEIQEPYALFRIEDDGAGFSKEELAHAFDDYVLRNNEKTTSTARGMGIGLSVCNTIVCAHNGTMNIQNRDIGGACVTFSLPLSEVHHGTEI